MKSKKHQLAKFRKLARDCKNGRRLYGRNCIPERHVDKGHKDAVDWIDNKYLKELYKHMQRYKNYKASDDWNVPLA